MKTVLKFLPEKVRHYVIRKMMPAPVSIEGLEIKLAENIEEYHQAFRLLYNSYLEKGYVQENSLKLHFTPYHALPYTSVIVAKIKGEVVGTISLILKTKFGVPGLTDDPGALNWKGDSRIIEISSLAISPAWRKNKGSLLFHLVRYLIYFGKNRLNVDFFLSVVNPAMADMYKALMAYEPVFSESHCVAYKYANGAPGVTLYVTYDMFKNNIRNAFSKIGKAAGFADFFRELDDPNFEKNNSYCKFNSNQTGIPHSQLDYDLFEQVFGDWATKLQSENHPQFTKEAFEKIAQFYQNEDISHALNASSDGGIDSRYHVVDHVLFDCIEVMDVSKNGLRGKIINQELFERKKSIIEEIIDIRWWSACGKSFGAEIKLKVRAIAELTSQVERGFHQHFFKENHREYDRRQFFINTFDPDGPYMIEYEVPKKKTA